MSVFPPLDETWMVTLECLSHLPGPRFLDGRVLDGTSGLAEHTNPPFTGTWWGVTTLAPGIVKFRCMTHVGGSPRFLDGHTHHGGVRLAPVLAIPLSGERWEVTERSGEVVTLRCLGIPASPEFRFLDGRTLDGTVGLAPHTDPPFSGTHWRVRAHGKIVVLECLGRGRGNCFLDGRIRDGTVALAPTAAGHFTSAYWLLQGSAANVTLKCLGEVEGPNRYLDGDLRPGQQTVKLAPHTGHPFTGTHWKLINNPTPHADVEPGARVTLHCLAAVASDFRFLNGVRLNGEGIVELSDTTRPPDDEPFIGTHWRLLPASLYWEPCPRFHEERTTFTETVQVVRTVRAGQITGREDPEQWPLINGNTEGFGVPGTDLGANTEDGHGRLFMFFGDVVQGNRSDGPVVDADFVAFTVDAVVQEGPGEAGGVRLHPTMDEKGRYFDPFRVDGVSGIGVTKTFEVPSGAFAHGGHVFVFFHTWDSPVQGCYLASKCDPGQPGPFTERFLFSPRRFLFSPRPLDSGGWSADCFSGVAPVKVQNADHAWLPENAAEIACEGVVMFGLGYNPKLGYSAIHLAWMPLTADGPKLEDVRYFVGGPQRWDSSPDNVVPLFGKQTNLQSISAAHLKGPDTWIVLHMTANGTNCMTGPIVARVGTPPSDWSEEFSLFDPCRERAYGRYMHWPDLDWIQLADPFRTPPKTKKEREDMEAERRDKVPAHAYGAFLLERYTRWDKTKAELDLYYLLSLWSPYQVQVMHTTLRLGVTIPPWLTKEEVEHGDDMGIARPSAAQLGLIATFAFVRQQPGFGHEQVFAIDPPGGTFVQRGASVAVTINLQG